MNIVRQKLLAAWVQFGLQPILHKAAELGVGLVIIGGTVTTVVVATPTQPKTAPPKPETHAIAAAPAKKPVVKRPSTPNPTPAPAPVATTPAPQPAAAPAVNTAAPQPIPASQPTPGSGAKQLVATPPTSSPTPPVPDPTVTGGTTSPSAPVAASGGYHSTNWAGYVALSGKFTAVTGTWTAPTVSGNGTDITGDATWIGIGGATSNDLIQTGTSNIIDADGTVHSFAFYELLPDAALEIRSITVHPGDVMSASISETTTSQWTIRITNTTTGQTYTKSVAYTSTYSSAEWIEEDPSYLDGSLVPFANFDHAIFSTATTTQNGNVVNLSGSSAAPITLVDTNGNPIVTPSILINSGDGFWALHN